jgi:hypothetical protein
MGLHAVPLHRIGFRHALRRVDPPGALPPDPRGRFGKAKRRRGERRGARETRWGTRDDLLGWGPFWGPFWGLVQVVGDSGGRRGEAVAVFVSLPAPLLVVALPSSAPSGAAGALVRCSVCVG